MPAPQPDERNIEAAVIAALAHACRVEPSALSAATQLLDLSMDSLTLVGAVTLVEADLALELGTNDVAELLAARDIATLVAVIRRRLRDGEKSGEDPGIASCNTPPAKI